VSCEPDSIQVSVGGKQLCWIKASSEFHGGELLCDSKHPFPNIDFVQVSCAEDACCALQFQNGMPKCWNSMGNEAWAPATSMIDISVGGRRSCGISATSSEIICWAGKLLEQEGIVVNVPVIQVSCGKEACCTIRKIDSSFACWGALSEDNPLIGRVSKKVSQLSLSKQRNFALAVEKGSDRVFGWGDNMYGETTNAPESRFSHVSAGEHTSCGVNSQGKIQCWGRISMLELPVSKPYFKYVSVGSLRLCGWTGKAVECFPSSVDIISQAA